MNTIVLLDQSWEARPKTQGTSLSTEHWEAMISEAVPSGSGSVSDGPEIDFESSSSGHSCRYDMTL